MSASTAARPATGALYTPELLSLAVSLAANPFDPSMPLAGEAHSRTCGSTILLSLVADADGRIERIGLRASACAVGQAAAALFVRAAVGRSTEEIANTRNALAGWLGGAGPMPDWPGLQALDAARAHPGRHGAILLAWNAALAALSNGEAPR